MVARRGERLTSLFTPDSPANHTRGNAGTARTGAQGVLYGPLPCAVYAAADASMTAEAENRQKYGLIR